MSRSRRLLRCNEIVIMRQRLQFFAERTGNSGNVRQSQADRRNGRSPLRLTMNDMSTTWNTKFGPRRVRYDPPTLQEAIIAAKGLSDQLLDQIEIAASLMDLPVEEVRGEVMKTASSRTAERIVAPNSREGTTRSVIVERKVSRRSVRATGA